MAEADTEPVTSAPPPRRSGGGRFMIRLIMLVMILALGGVVVYLLSDLNRRQYRMVAEEGVLVVERGRQLPFGFEVYEPDAEALRAAYAPIPLPPNTTLSETEVFEERADLDRALFGMLAGWARAGLDADQPGAIELARGYVSRCDMLPGLSEEQRDELRMLRADLAYLNGRRILGDVVNRLNKALKEFELAVELGTSRPSDAQKWIGEVKRRMSEYSNEPEAPAEPEPVPLADPGLPQAIPQKIEEKPQEEAAPPDGEPSKWRL